MDLGTSSLLVILLLAAAASLASYWFSQYSPLRADAGAARWLSIGGAATWLLIVAGVVVFLVSRLPSELFASAWSIAPSEIGEIARTAHSDGVAAPVDSQTVSSSSSGHAASTRTATDSVEQRTAQSERTHEDYAQPSASQSQRNSASTLRDPSRGARLVQLSAGNVWAASRCVSVYQPDSGDATRWIIDNGCGDPVVVILSDCGAENSSCSGLRRSMLLPGKQQRPVTWMEETHHGMRPETAACLVLDPEAIQLVGADAESRGSLQWQEQFVQAQGRDSCLAAHAMGSH